MTRYRFEFPLKRVATVAALASSLIVAGACSLGTTPGNQPTRAEITIDGTTPNPLKLIISTDFFEQLNTSSGALTPILVKSDTVLITPPYSNTVDISTFGSIYVELLQPEVETASVHMKVDLDNGEGYEQNATLADRAQLIYYYIFTQYSY
jgi:hypothetical protein